METAATGQARIEFCKLSEAKLPVTGPVVHIKGFASGIDFSQPAVARALEAISRFVDEQQPATIAFDGDGLRDGSFTQLVRRLADSGVRELLAFRYDSPTSEKNVRRSWCDTQLQMVCVLVPPWEGHSLERYVRLGKMGLEHTGGKVAVCLGGGHTTSEEACQMPGVQFHVWPIHRTLNDGSIQECQINSELPNVTIHGIDHNPLQEHSA